MTANELRVLSKLAEQARGLLNYVAPEEVPDALIEAIAVAEYIVATTEAES